MKQVQDFYKSTITQDWSIGLGNFYVSIKPTITEGWLYISPNNASVRECVYYNGTGTDANGDYITITERGLGSTSEQTHTIGEPVRMNIGEGYVEYLTDAIDDIVAGAAPNADTSTKGLVEIATDAEVIAGTEVGGTGAMLAVTPKTLMDNKTRLSTEPVVRTYNLADSPATWTKPVGLTQIEVKLWAGGGGGASSTSATQGGGGGGGACNIAIFRASELGVTETITIGAGGAGGGASSNTAGVVGGNSTFGALLTSYGGGGGGIAGGGGGGGISSAGIQGTNDGSNGGNPIPGLGTGVTTSGASGGFSIYGGGGGGDTASNGGFSIYGGGGGGGSDGGTGTGAGGASIYGGGGGGGEDSGGLGGVSTFGGNGGNGRANGVVPAGGGGGADINAAAGNGAAGRCIITEYF